MKVTKRLKIVMVSPKGYIVLDDNGTNRRVAVERPEDYKVGDSFSLTKMEEDIIPKKEVVKRDVPNHNPTD